LHRRIAGSSEERALLADPPTPLGRDWLRHVNQPQSEAEELALRACIARGKPFGSERWTTKIARQLNLQSTLRPRGRPRTIPAAKPASGEGEKDS
jgi:putative transposase